MYKNHIIVGLSIFGVFLAGGYVLNNKLAREYRDDQIHPISYYYIQGINAEKPMRLDQSIMRLPTFKPREYVKIEPRTYQLMKAEDEPSFK
ncbi:hypothetical protein [Priestia koreensis]|uniref:Uncharacterized protein n=1 Tax=Priestia koreensis TaxID=284581 RepID=A0A0M0LBZ2_9BACI|nr:hypothetical protein [Priestia koreensis]KOO48531.1 hypothetical protein AMD01_04705 [Priestia koreensis]